MSKSAIITLPPERWREAKQLRLEALLKEPTAFSSSYEYELAFNDEVWIARLTSAYAREGHLTLFAELDGELVGMAGASWSSKAKPRHVAEIYGVYLSPEWRGKGLASRLMRRLLDELRSLGQIEKVSLTANAESQAAIRLYERLGMQHVGRARRKHPLDAQYYDLVYLELHFTLN